jgi:hypothetical protein
LDLDPVNEAIQQPAVNLLFHPFNGGDGPFAPRPADLPVWDGYLAPDKESVDHWAISDYSLHGIWIEGENKHGVIAFTSLGGGHLTTEILDDPRNSRTTIVVADPGDIMPGDVLYVSTTELDAQGHPFGSPVVESVEGNVIHFRPEGEGPQLPGDPLVGGAVHTGEWYALAGTGGITRWYTVWYVYDPADLAQVAQGGLSLDSVPPASMTQVEYPGVDSLHDMGFYSYTNGATYDPTTHRLYVLAGSATTTVYVYELDDTPATPDPSAQLQALLAKVLAFLRELITWLRTLYP